MAPEHTNDGEGEFVSGACADSDASRRPHKENRREERLPNYEEPSTVTRLLMSDDLVLFEPAFGSAIAVGKLAVAVRGSANPRVNGRKLCLEKDVKKATASVAYTAATHPIPGSARLKIERLDARQLSKVITSEGTPVVLAIGRARAKLEVISPALGPPPASRPDTARSYTGSARFTTIGDGIEGD